MSYFYYLFPIRDSYDVYLTKEPNAYEAMALVHSRVRRVVFGTADKEMGGLGGVADSIDDGFKRGIHCLPGTNHHYRAFRLNDDLSSANDDNDAESRKRLIESLRALHSDGLSNFDDNDPVSQGSTF